MAKKTARAKSTNNTNTKGPGPAGYRAGMDQLVMNAMTMRSQFLKQMFDPRRNIDQECGYPETYPTSAEYRRMYDTEGFAQRVVGLVPDECWKKAPKIKENEEADETDFEKSFNEFQKKHNIIHYLARLDEMSGIGRYGLLLFGLNDGLKLDQPVKGSNEDGTWQEGNQLEVTFLRVFDESLISITAYEQDPTNPRFGQPTKYNITFVDPTTQGEGTASQPDNATQLEVHWSRVVHVADQRKTSEIFGASRQLVVWNRLLDCKKVFGGSGEMYWRGAFPGISLESQSGIDPSDVELDISATRDQMELYMNSLQRYMLTTGMNAKSLAPQVASPEPFFKTTTLGITVPLKCPYRIFIGSEQASMASTQDIETWNNRMNKRNLDYTAPMLVQPVVQRLIDYGALAPPDKPEEGMEVGTFEAEFPDLNAPTDKDKIENSGKIVEAMAKYVQSGASELIAEKEFLTIVMDYTEEQADEILEAAAERMDEMHEAEMHADELLRERIAHDPEMRQAPPEGAERIPLEPVESPNGRPRA